MVTKRLRKADIRRIAIKLITFRLRMEYQQVPKGRGYLYVNRGHIYRQVKKLGHTRYLRCHIARCAGSAKLENYNFIVGKTTQH